MKCLLSCVVYVADGVECRPGHKISAGSCFFSGHNFVIFLVAFSAGGASIISRWHDICSSHKPLQQTKVLFPFI